MARTAETAFNVELGKALRRRHPRWPDRIGVDQTDVFAEAAGLRPDIVVRHPGGLPVVVETEYAPATTVEQDARDRLGRTVLDPGEIVEQTIAVRIPADLAFMIQKDLEAGIESARLEFCILSSASGSPGRWPGTGWLDGSVDDLAACIELASFSENRLAQGLTILETGIGGAARYLRRECRDAPDTLVDMADELHQRDGEQTSRMAMAILANALVFHEAVAGAHGVEAPGRHRGPIGKMSKESILQTWWRILREINYWPIFKIATDILLPIRSRIAQGVLNQLVYVAEQLAALGATSQHDLAGRMFQRLISDRKFLATFYTLPSSSALLAELAVARLDIDWSDRKAVTGLRIGDFACGTGALLNAAYEAVLSRYRRRGGDDAEIHHEMMESVLVGADIMPAATHLTASVLSSVHPSMTFANTSIVTLPYGRQPDDSGRPIAIGALDLIEDETTIPLFGAGQQRLIGVGDSPNIQVDMPHGGFDLVIMNPPFTRPTNHESTETPIPSFAGFSTSEEEQKHMSNRLRKLRKRGMAGHGNAGLASNFIDLAHAKVREDGGVLALVLPASFLQGEAWKASRRLLAEHYRDILIVSIADAGATDRAFSADTGMAEVLVLATRGKGETNDALFANLLRRPPTILEAATVANAIRRVPADSSAGGLAIGSAENAGCSIRSAFSDTGCAGVREPGIVRAASKLAQGELFLPRRIETEPLPVAELGALGVRGLLHRDIFGAETTHSGLPRGPFDIRSIGPGEVPTWPMLWAHDAARERQLAVEPDSAGQVRPGCESRAAETWERTASRLHFNLDFQLNAQSLAACMTPEPSIGGTAWPNFLCADRRWEAPLVLWASTTLGLLAFWWIGTRQQQGRARLTISKLPALTALDVRQLSAAQLDHAEAMFGDFEHRPMLPANEAWRDETRQALDRAVLIDLLGLPDDILEPLALLRRQWCVEPSVHGGKATAPT